MDRFPPPRFCRRHQQKISYTLFLGITKPHWGSSAAAAAASASAASFHRVMQCTGLFLIHKQLNRCMSSF